MPCDAYGIFVLLFFQTVNSCGNLSLFDRTFGHVENVNFFLGQSQPKNLSCSWRIPSEKQSNIVLSLRVIEVETDRRTWSNELVLKTDVKEILVNNINQRTFSFSSVSNLQIDFRIKSPNSQSSSLNIHRFLLEFSQIDTNTNGFQCLKSGLRIPKQWKCNCLYECGLNDVSDEDNCPLCSVMTSSTNLLCHSNEIWCLPVTSEVDSKGVCLSSEQSAQCSYRTQCETILVYSEEHGEILLDNQILSNRQSLCFIIIAKEKHYIRLIVNEYAFLDERPDFEFFIYDGDERQNQLLLSSDSLLTERIVQTRENYVATIVVRKRSIEIENSEDILLNITWLTSVCPENQFLCGGHLETKCYSKEQRCDGIWDCLSGDDELGCLPSSCPTTFACYNQLRLSSDQPRCYTWFERCNGNAFCPNRRDEHNCTSWWCNSNNGTFLCHNRYCIYENWVCDGTNDCGDNSDELHCPSRIPRRIVTAIVIGGTICCTLFLLALGCTCKLFQLRSADQRASVRLLNSQQQDSDESQRMAPPSYNQTMGFSNINDDRQAILAEQLRLAGLANFIPSRSRRHRHRRNRHEDSHDTLIESQSTRLDRFRSLFTPNLSINNNIIPSNEIDISERHISATIFSLESRELPPPYSEERRLSPPIATIDGTEQANSDDDDDKMLVP